MEIDRGKIDVSLLGLLRSEEWSSAEAQLPVPIGIGAGGFNLVDDLVEMHDVMIAGGDDFVRQGFIKSWIIALLSRFPPHQLRLVIIAARGPALDLIASVPHLASPVVSTAEGAMEILDWLLAETDARFDVFAKAGARNIHDFNARPKGEPGTDGTIPQIAGRIVVVIDGWGELLWQTGGEIEMVMNRLAEMAYAVGFHYLLGMESASLDLFPRVATQHIPARVALGPGLVAESRRFLGCTGWEKSRGKGDILYRSRAAGAVIRARMVRVGDREQEMMVKQLITGSSDAGQAGLMRPRPDVVSGELSPWTEDLVQACIKVIRSTKIASVPQLQRKLRLGFTMAVRLMSELEARGVVGPGKFYERRKVLIAPDSPPSGNKQP